MKSFMSVVALTVCLLAVPGWAQHREESSAPATDVLALMPAEVLPKLEMLASILQRNLTEGRLTEGQIGQELENGDLATLIQELGPDAAGLLQEIQSSLQSHHTNTSLTLMLQTLLGPTAALGQQ